MWTSLTRVQVSSPRGLRCSPDPACPPQNPFFVSQTTASGFLHTYPPLTALSPARLMNVPLIPWEHPSFRAPSLAMVTAQQRGLGPLFCHEADSGAWPGPPTLCPSLDLCQDTVGSFPSALSSLHWLNPASKHTCSLPILKHRIPSFQPLRHLFSLLQNEWIPRAIQSRTVLSSFLPSLALLCNTPRNQATSHPTAVSQVLLMCSSTRWRCHSVSSAARTSPEVASAHHGREALYSHQEFLGKHSLPVVWTAHLTFPA